MQSELAECPFGNPQHCEDEEGIVYCDACWDAMMPDWKGYDDMGVTARGLVVCKEYTERELQAERPAYSDAHKRYLPEPEEQ